MKASGLRLLLAASVCLAAVPAGAQPVADDVVDTLREALAMAYRTNPTLLAARANQRATDENVPIERADGLPSLNATGNASQSIYENPDSGSPVRSATAQLSLGVPLYSGGGVRNGIRAAETRVLAGRADLRGTESAVFNQVVAAYLESLPDTVTLVHGDFRLDNMMFATPAGGYPLAVVDWQTLAVAFPGLDVAYFLGAGLRAGLRVEHERALLARYRAGLARHGVQDWSEGDVWEAYRLGAWHGVFMSVIHAMRMRRGVMLVGVVGVVVVSCGSMSWTVGSFMTVRAMGGGMSNGVRVSCSPVLAEEGHEDQAEHVEGRQQGCQRQGDRREDPPTGRAPARGRVARRSASEAARRRPLDPVRPEAQHTDADRAAV